MKENEDQGEEKGRTEDTARQDAVQRAMRLSEHLIRADSQLLQQFGRQMQATFTLTDESRTTEEIEESIAAVLRLVKSYGIDFDELK